MADKQIKISIVVDQNSATTAKRLISDINSEVQKLIESSQRATQALGGVGGVKVGNQNISIPGMGGAQHQSSQNYGSKAGFGGIFNGIAGGISSIKSAIFGSKAIFKDISDGLKTFSDTGSASINTLTDSVQKLNRELGTLRNSVGGIGGINIGGGGFGGGGRGPTGTLLGMGPGAPMPTAPGAHPVAAPPSGGGGNPPGQPPAPPPVPPPGGFRAMLSQAGRMLGGTPGGPLAAIGYGLNMANQVVDPAIATESAQLSFAKQHPMMDMQRSAAWGVFERESERIRTGDIRGIISRRMDPRVAEVQSALTGTAYQENLRRAIRISLRDPSDTGKLSDTGAWLKGIVGEKFSGMRQSALETAEEMANRFKGTSGNMSEAQRKANPAYGKTQLEIAETLMEQNIAQDTPGRIMEVQRLAEQRNLRTQRIGQEIYGGAMGTAALARGGFMGGIGGVNPKTGKLRYIEREAQLAKMGLTLSDEASARAMAASGVGAEYAGSGMGLFGMQSGGFGAAGGMAASAAMTGTSRGGMRGFLNQIQGSMGRGGIQIGAANRFASMFASQMQGTTGLGGLDYGGAFQQMAGGIQQLGGDQNAARIYGAGLAESGAIQSGSKDGLQQALNMHSGVKAFGNNWQAIDAMSKMSPTDRAAIMNSEAYIKNGTLPSYLTDLGITKPQMEMYVKDQDKMALVRYAQTPGVDGTAAGKAAKIFTQSNGIKDYVSKMGVEGIEQKDALRMLGSAYGAAGSDPASGMGMVQQMAEREGLVPAISGGRGAHGAKAGGLTQTALNSKGKIRDEDAGLAGAGAGALAVDFMKAPGEAGANESFARAGGQLAMSPEGINVAMSAFLKAIANAASVINNKFGQTSRVSGNK